MPISKRKYTYVPASKKTKRESVRIIRQYDDQQRLAADYVANAVTSINFADMPSNYGSNVKSIKISNALELFESTFSTTSKKIYQLHTGTIRISDARVLALLSVVRQEGLSIDDLINNKTTAAATALQKPAHLDLEYKFWYSKKLRAPFAAKIMFEPAYKELCEWKTVMYNGKMVRVWTEIRKGEFKKLLDVITSCTASWWFNRYRLVKTGRINVKFAKGYPKRQKLYDLCKVGAEWFTDEQDTNIDVAVKHYNNK